MVHIVLRKMRIVEDCPSLDAARRVLYTGVLRKRQPPDSWDAYWDKE
jgi:hypothetical protein